MCEITVTQIRTHQCLCIQHLLRDAMIILYILLGLVGSHASNSHGRQTTVKLLLIQFHLRPTHKLWFADGTQMVELAHGRKHFSSCLIAILTAEPRLQMPFKSIGLHLMDIPSQIEKQLQIVGGHLYIVYIGYPLTTDTMAVGLLHLLEDKTRLRGGQPQIVVGASPIAQVIIYACSSAPSLLLVVAQSSEIPIVVVAPHQHHVVGNTQPILIDFQYFFVRNKNLRRLSLETPCKRRTV